MGRPVEEIMVDLTAVAKYEPDETVDYERVSGVQYVVADPNFGDVWVLTEGGDLLRVDLTTRQYFPGVMCRPPLWVQEKLGISFDSHGNCIPF